MAIGKPRATSVVAVRLQPGELATLTSLVNQANEALGGGVTPAALIRGLIAQAGNCKPGGSLMVYIPRGRGEPLVNQPEPPLVNQPEPPLVNQPEPPLVNQPPTGAESELDLATLLDDIEVGSRVAPTTGLYVGVRGRVTRLVEGKATVEFKSAQGNLLTVTLAVDQLQAL